MAGKAANTKAANKKAGNKKRKAKSAEGNIEAAFAKVIEIAKIVTNK